MKRIQKLLALSCALALTAPLAGCQGPKKTPVGTSGADPASITFPYTGDPVALKGLWCNHNNRKNDTLIYNEYLRPLLLLQRRSGLCRLRRPGGYHQPVRPLRHFLRL